MAAFQKIKSDAQTKRLAAVMLSPLKESPGIGQCYDFWTSSYIVQPVHFGVFAQANQSLGFYWPLLNQPFS